MLRRAAAAAGSKVGKVAIRKRVLEPSGAEAMVDLANFRFRVLDATGAPVGDEFMTDAAGHALSGELAVDADYTLEELAPPAGLQQAAPAPFRLDSARVVIRVDNTVLPGGGGYNP